MVIYACKKFWFWENFPYGVHSYVRPPLHVSGCQMTHFNTIWVKLGIGHPCCDQLIAVKKGYLLVSVTWLHCGLRYTTHGSDVIFWSYPLTSCLFLIDHGHRSIFLMVEFSLLSAYGQSMINWGRHFLQHPCPNLYIEYLMYICTWDIMFSILFQQTGPLVVAEPTGQGGLTVIRLSRKAGDLGTVQVSWKVGELFFYCNF